MKKKFLRIGICLPMILSLALVACNKDSHELSVAVSGTDIAAAYAGGEYNFYYAVNNGASDGAVTCVTDADWISGFTYEAATDSKPANVLFTVEENEDAASRTGVISLVYSDSEETMSKSITLTQAGVGSRDTEFNVADLTGTYKAVAKAQYSYGTVYETTWNLIIMKNGADSLYIDGLLPYTAGQYVNFGDQRVSAVAYLNDRSEIVVPSGMASCMVQTYYGNYHVGYTPCVQYDRESGSSYYDDEFPDLTFTYDSSAQTWTSDYGVICAGCTKKDISTLSIFVSTIYPSITLTKTSSDTPDSSNVDILGTSKTSAAAASSGTATSGLSAGKTQQAHSVRSK